MARTRRAENDVERGKRFREVCQELFPGKARAYIGEMLGGISGSTVRNWEQGSAPAPDALAKLTALGASLAYILHGEGPALAPAGAADTAADTLATMDPKLRARIIGANLRHLRRKRNPDWGGQKKFAEFLGLSANDLSVYEYGRAIPNEHRLDAIAARLGLTVEDLCRPLPGVTVPEADTDELPRRRETRLLPVSPDAKRREDELVQEIARLEGRMELLQEQNAAQEERIRQLQEANYVLRDLLYIEDTPETRERRERLLSRLNPSIAELARRRDLF